LRQRVLVIQGSLHHASQYGDTQNKPNVKPMMQTLRICLLYFCDGRMLCVEALIMLQVLGCFDEVRDAYR
jgi:hypothetical protein